MMEKRELSSTLKNLKFMQRATQREEKIIKQEAVKSAGNIFLFGIKNKCVVIMEGDPHPGAVKGRISFLSFNPSIDKLNDEATNRCQPETLATYSGNHSGKVLCRDNESSPKKPECSNVNEVQYEANGNVKRKQPEVESKTPYAKKSRKDIQDSRQSSPIKSKGSYKQPKHDKLDWNVLRPSKSQS